MAWGPTFFQTLGIWSTQVIGSCLQSSLEGRTHWVKYEASQWHHRVSQTKSGFKLNWMKKNQCIISFHCVLVLISFVMFMIGIVKQEYIWWYFHIISIENNINLSWSVSITVVSLWAWWRLKLIDWQLFTQLFIEVLIKENIKAPHHWT